MADLTDEEEERLEPQPHIAANVEAIANMVDKNGLIAKAEEKAAKARGDLGRHYQKVENDYHGNRKAVKLIRTLVGGTIDAAYDFMRTFMPLAEHFELVPGDDLVSPSMKKADAGSGEAEGVFDLPSRRRSASAIDRARDHLQGGTKPGEDGEEAARTQQARREERGFAENAPAGPPGDEDLADPGAKVAEGMAAVAARAKGEQRPPVTH
jgi:hypothetical protein